MKLKKFLINTLILTIGSLVLRFIGVAFGAYLSKKIGAEGVGLYQLVFTVYNFASTIATSGIYLAVTRLVSEEMGKGRYDAANDAMKKCAVYGIVVSLLASTLLYTLASPISFFLIDDERAVLSLRILAFALPFMAFSSSLRGYFFAIRQVIKSVSSQIFEQVVRIAVVSIGFLFVLPGGLENACAAVALGSVGGEALAFLFTGSFYLMDIRKRSFRKKKYKETTRKVLSITIPVALSSYLKSALVTVENVLIPKGFKRYGSGGAGALAQYGMMEAMVMPILSFPAAFLTSFSSLLVPELAESNALKRQNEIDRLASRVIRLTLLFALPIAGCFVCFGEELGIAVYQNAETGHLLRLMAPLVPIMYLDLVTDAMLKGLDQQVSVLRYSVIDSLISIVLIWALIPLYGVSGYIAVLFISTFVNAVLSINRLIEVTSIRFSLSNWLIKPLISVFLASFCIFTIGKNWMVTPGLGALIKITLTFIIYFLFVFFSGAFSFSEVIRLFKMMSLPKKTGTLLSKTTSSGRTQQS